MIIDAVGRTELAPPPAGPPKVCWAISGNSALGRPKTIAMMSSRKEANRTFRVARYRKPSITWASPARRAAPSSGGKDGSRHTAHMVRVSPAASIR